jgi:hypothetical protein
MGSAARARRFLRFVAFAIAIVAAILALGFQPTRRLAGETGPWAMAAGCTISLVAALLAGWLVVIAAPATANARMQAAFLAMLVRLAVVVALGAAAVFSGMFSRSPLLFWLATSYVVLLPLEVKLAIESES